MLLRRVQALPYGSSWQYEVKWDGYWMQALKSGGTMRLLSRNGADYTTRFATVAAAVARLKAASLHLDGELVALDGQGRPSFQRLQGRGPLPGGWQIGYYAFDLVRLGRHAIHHLPLHERRSALEHWSRSWTALR